MVTSRGSGHGLHGRLVETGEAEQVRARHLTYFLALVESVEPEIAFADSARLLAMLELEHDNLDAALDFADASGRREDALRLAASMTLFWELRGHLGRGSRWLARLLDEVDDEPSAWRGRACWGAAHIGLYGGDVETMSVRAPEALELAERFDDDWIRARALNTMGLPLATAHRIVGDLDRAGALLDDLAGLAAGLGNDWVGALVDLERSCVALARDDVEEADGCAHSALAVFARLGRRPDIVAAIEQLGCVAASLDSGAEGLRCFGAAEAARAEIGLATPAPVADVIARWRGTLGESLGVEVVEGYSAEGVALGLDRAVEYVSRARGERKRPNAGWASLTPTERRVSELVADGLTKPQIAEQMFIARGTVKVHVSHIFAKLGLSNRAELAVLATRRSADAGR